VRKHGAEVRRLTIAFSMTLALVGLFSLVAVVEE
jgi:hypothetical protein